MTADRDDLELPIRRVIREADDSGRACELARQLRLCRARHRRPFKKSWPIETFFHKVVMLRNRLRTLEQHINSAELPDDVKVKLQAYISGCYGTLTSFNVLFAEEEDQFKGAGGE